MVSKLLLPWPSWSSKVGSRWSSEFKQIGQRERERERSEQLKKQTNRAEFRRSKNAATSRSQWRRIFHNYPTGSGLAIIFWLYRIFSNLKHVAVLMCSCVCPLSGIVLCLFCYIRSKLILICHYCWTTTKCLLGQGDTVAAVCRCWPEVRLASSTVKT